MRTGRLKRFLAKARPDWLRRTKRVPARPQRGSVNHVIILDGTMSSLDIGEETNAGLIYKLVAEKAGAGMTVYYEAGIQWTSWRSTMDVLLGRGINRQIQRAYGHLASRYRPGDRIFLFGYSRGAYAARSLAGVIDRIGLLRAPQATERNVRQAYRLYQECYDQTLIDRFASGYCHPSVEIEMIGAFDTVKSLGLRLPFLWRLAENKHGFHNHALSACVKSGFHALALEETRQVYAPVMWESDPDWAGRLEQVWFAGTHGDVGGQLGGFEAARPLANIPLVWMLGQAEMRKLPLPVGWRDRFVMDVDAPSVGQWRGISKLFLLRKPRHVGTDPSERLHDSAIARGAYPTQGQLA
ncbi:DUF2235 domain-containing protein [Pseudooceanicola sediminis]|uniref:DUF2235 domain-containing protein n=1 Tax=Pseudooceanicola sediminis TaxID=2211117 RepID=A0A399J1P6_9RHOB|nr:DUF2235 domain-containing protein [Pseudooceanicola sediminis]KAA2313196.1 DUF2235 domain-containing protein [Puniceibacterium sp. HSS470]RII37842.1 DUF2235 domain-containing protein [Pseudooceanicola sediminis]|tara:strand:+ start:60736 stop:61797 length:1062 start_codon:yes stop_codon:yes gene_type:complete